MKKLLIFLALLFPTASFAADAQQMILCTEQAVMSGSINGSNSNDQLVINSADDSIGMAIQMPEAATITQLCVNHAQRSAGDPPAYTIALQGASTTSALADGTTKQSGNASCTYDPPANGTQDGTEQCCTMTSSYSATAGEKLFVIISSASASAGNNSGFGVARTGNDNPISYPYGYTITDGGAASYKGRPPLVAVRSASRYYGNIPLNHTLSTYNANSTPNEKGLYFTIPSTFCSNFTLKKVLFYGRMPLAGTSANAQLYDSDGNTLLDSAVIDGDQTSAAGTGNDRKIISTVFDDQDVLTCGTSYYVGLLANDNTSAVGFSYSTYTSTSAVADIAWTSTWQLATRTNSGNTGSWTTSGLSQPAICLVLSTWTAPAGGGLLAPKSLSGGTQ